MTPLTIGVICEGQTDYYALREFITPALREKGINIEFKSIQPNVSNTASNGGWGKIENWFVDNKPEWRPLTYFDKGLFGEASEFACDILLIQMDADILDEPTFQKHMKNNYQMSFNDCHTPELRGRHVLNILRKWADMDQLEPEYHHRHIFAPAVESSETWCVAAFDHTYPTPETLKSQDLINAFMAALVLSENRSPSKIYANINKDKVRREKFCAKHSGGYQRVIDTCPHFKKAVDEIINANNVVNSTPTAAGKS